jgi:predicted ABC-type ATPase
LNVQRVKQRSGLGGHDVPSEKILDRYMRSLKLVPAAIESAVRAFVFDNTGEAPVWLAEKSPDGLLHLRRPESDCPAWFRTAVLPFARLAL